MRSHRNHILLAAAAILMAMLACERFEKQTQGGQLVSTCSRTDAIGFDEAVKEESVNELGGQTCKYSFSILNDTDEDILPVFYLHHTDGYQHMDEYVWEDYPPLRAHGSLEFSGSVYTLDDPDMSGPVATVAERIVGIKLDYGDCWALRKDKTFLNTFSKPLPTAACEIKKKAGLPALFAAITLPGE